MLPVALARPLWWLALRSLRFVTGLVLLALTLGTGGGPATPAGSPVAAEARPAATTAAEFAAVPGPESAMVPAQEPAAVAGDTAAGSGAAGEHAPWAERTGTLAGIPAGLAPSRAAIAIRRPAGHAYGRASGPRAPPQA